MADFIAVDEIQGYIGKTVNSNLAKPLDVLAKESLNSTIGTTDSISLDKLITNNFLGVAKLVPSDIVFDNVISSEFYNEEVISKVIGSFTSTANGIIKLRFDVKSSYGGYVGISDMNTSIPIGEFKNKTLVWINLGNNSYSTKDMYFSVEKDKTYFIHLVSQNNNYPAYCRLVQRLQSTVREPVGSIKSLQSGEVDSSSTFSHEINVSPVDKQKSMLLVLSTYGGEITSTYNASGYIKYLNLIVVKGGGVGDKRCSCRWYLLEFY